MKLGGRILFVAIFAYLLGDFLVFKGPLYRVVSGNDKIVARVSGYPIYGSQLDRAIREGLWFQGKSKENLNPSELASMRLTVLNVLIDHAALRLLVKAAKPPITVSDAEIDARLKRFTARFKNQEALESSLKAAGIGDLRERLRSQIQQEKYLAQRIESSVQVSDEEAHQWFTAHQAELAQPERIEARHIFIPTLDHPPEDAKRKLDQALVEVTEKKKDFTTLAKELSEDPATKDQGGALGWMTRARLPADFAAPLFDMQPLEPALIRTKLGWHLVEVTARKASEPRSFENAKPEIVAALQAIKRQAAIGKLRKELRQATAGIEIL